ncbi:cyclin-dependent protein kinase inhibitor SMR14 [Impatiens glandulifera]|uniref:cyclin-dependent protein kinase inhibitor SMR14 n=1 Tax=Impatiens glandulifera TaxID=253017 RepID=UPI001FB0D93C|nr:cyclin-dependent protein kinase inhibitor SMR14 [Impatiens glandulifera]
MSILENMSAIMGIDNIEDISSISSLTSIRIPDCPEKEEEDGVGPVGGTTTPTKKRDLRAIILQCPPAPRKSKPSPALFLGKRHRDHLIKGTLLLDMSHEVQALFPVGFMSDLRRKIKKARTYN